MKTITKTVDKAVEDASKIINPKDETKKFDKKDIERNKGYAILSYLCFLVLIPYFSNKKELSKYVKFHVKEGMNLFIIEIFFTILYLLLNNITVHTVCRDLLYNSYECSLTPWYITVPLNIIGILIVILAVIGLVNVFNEKAKKLPILSKIPIFK